MKCVICKQGNTRAGTATVILERDGSTVVFHKVPADVCDNCGEAYHSSEVTEALLQQAAASIAQGAEVDIRRYAVAA
ncbi:type II toxin-antitoxin system MqsA family antitoxin [Candidatus Methylospira mobilis]|uniref:Type II toxin-antitoxin system MqsA family antitoxin n=1 Tax=Candidatus Methylospira mobilis TaxID=1808979 RepID=A0A5Q0BKS6_9GAMM|nr:type II toxin-antitoxin system MqsA family antitoxin [Candidatus Methylospira mobilis]